MTDSLRLVGPKTLTAADSNVTTEFNLPASTAKDDVWCTDLSADCVDQTLLQDSGSHDYGTYFNWYTATAGSGRFDSPHGSNAVDSVCPKSWRLPTGGSTGEPKVLYDSYDSSLAMRDIPARFVLSGYRRGGGIVDPGGRGIYWASTVTLSGAGGRAYGLNIYTNSVGPGNENNMNSGFAVRCIAQ